MAKVLCTLKFASELINGVKFVESELGKVSEEVTEEVAAFFASIPGYSLIAKEVKGTAKAAAATTKADAPQS